MATIASSTGTLLAALAATGALWFTGQSLHATNSQLGMAQQTAVTDRFRLAAEQLSSDKTDVRLSGIYLFERLAKDSPADHMTVYSLLAAFIRTHAPVTACPASPELMTAPVDIQAAMTVIIRRDTSQEQSTDRLDLNRTCLAAVDLAGANLARVNLYNANLTAANLYHANLSGAILARITLTNAGLNGANLAGAALAAANLTGAILAGANLQGAYITHANLTGTYLVGANLNDIQYDPQTRWPDNFTPPPAR